MFTNDESLEKGKSFAFLAEEQDIGSEIEEHDEETLALITKNFTKILKQISQRNRGRGRITFFFHGEGGGNPE